MDTLIIFVTPAFLICVGLAITWFRRLSFREDLAFRPPPLRATGIWLAAFIALMILSEAISRGAGFEDSSGSWRGKYDTAQLAIRLFAVGLLYPVVEEFFFRGVLLGVVKRRFNALAAITASSLAFALIHIQYDWRQMMLSWSTRSFTQRAA